MTKIIVAGLLPALNTKATGRRFKRMHWDKGISYAFAGDCMHWYYLGSSGKQPLSDENKIASDWYEIDKDGLEFAIFDSMNIDLSMGDLTIRSAEEELEKIYNNEKETTMEDEAVKVFTDLEKRTKYTGELYGPDGKGRGILAFDKKSDAKAVLAAPENLGCYIVLRKEVGVYTTAVPVVKAKDV